MAGETCQGLSLDLDFCSSPYRNSFVLEYCGEVLDHKEFKARVKEYARSKNIHYYFMALKNDEVRSQEVDPA